VQVWLKQTDLGRATFLERFENPSALLAAWREAVIGLPPFVMFRPESWYKRAASTDEAIARLGEILTAWLVWTTDSSLRADLMLALEDCESRESRAFVSAIFDAYERSPFDPPALEADPNRPQAEPASEKQRNYLRRLGHKNFRGSKWEASRLIEKLKNQQS
jgi:hypothetical protein